MGLLLANNHDRPQMTADKYLEDLGNPRQGLELLVIKVAQLTSAVRVVVGSEQDLILVRSWTGNVCLASRSQQPSIR